MFVRQQYRREYGKGLPHKKPIASETDACKMKSFARLGGLKEAPASIGGEYFTKAVLFFIKNKYIYYLKILNVCVRIIMYFIMWFYYPIKYIKTGGTYAV